jgi:copper(I)-binding protein
MRAMQTTRHSTARARCVRSLLATALIAIALPAAADVSVTGAWVRGTVAGQSSTGAFMQIKSPTDTALVAISSPAAKIAEVHSMKMEGGVMKMNAVDKVAVPAGQAVELKPGGYHVMLLDLVAPLKEGDSVPLKLTFEDKAGKKETLDVKGRGAAARSRRTAYDEVARASALMLHRSRRFALTARHQPRLIGLTT